jgi:hypothetical protein
MPNGKEIERLAETLAIVSDWWYRFHCYECDPCWECNLAYTRSIEQLRDSAVSLASSEFRENFQASPKLSGNIAGDIGRNIREGR